MTPRQYATRNMPPLFGPPNKGSRHVPATFSRPGVTPKRVGLSYNATGQFETIERYSSPLSGGGRFSLVASSSDSDDAFGLLRGLVHSSPAMGNGRAGGSGFLFLVAPKRNVQPGGGRIAYH